MQKEFSAILSAIDKWNKKNDGNVCFVGSFISFDEDKIEKGEDDIIKDNVIVGYGDIESVRLSLEELNAFLKIEKKDFINW